LATNPGFWQYGGMAKKKKSKPRKKKSAPKPDVNQIAAQIVAKATS
jgi:hypothetical protein